MEPAIPLHLLAYLFDPTEPALVAELTRIRAAREVRAERIVDLLRADGVDVTWDEVRGLRGRRHRRPAAHRAGADPAPGWSPPPSEAFAPQWLGERYRLPKDDTEVFTARAAGPGAPAAYPVFAHPRATRRGRVVPDSLIVELAAAGLFGLEADHADHSRRGARARAGAGASRWGWW